MVGFMITVHVVGEEFVLCDVHNFGVCRNDWEGVTGTAEYHWLFEEVKLTVIAVGCYDVIKDPEINDLNCATINFHTSADTRAVVGWHVDAHDAGLHNVAIVIGAHTNDGSVVLKIGDCARVV